MEPNEILAAYFFYGPGHVTVTDPIEIVMLIVSYQSSIKYQYLRSL